jgi:hypothetical protein
MRALHGLAGLAAVAAGATVLDVEPAAAVCSVFDRHPCLPTVCSVFRRRPCIPEIDYPIGQDLRLTIESAADQPADGAKNNKTDNKTDDKADDKTDDHEASDRKLDTLRAMFDALRACWVPPEKDEARPGMQMSVRFAFKRSGEIIAAPRVTYASPGVPGETREAYLKAISAALERCTPLHFTAGLGGAVAGRPIAIRFVDNRDLP